jgi:hypothetical protein
MRMAALSLLLVVAACGGSEGSPKQPPTSAPPSSQAVVQPTVAPPTGDPVPEALSQFRCDPDGAGTFQASGVVENAAKGKVTFQVTVYVGEPQAVPQSAKTKQLAGVAGGGSIPFEIYKIPAPPAGGTCHVQVLTTK